jgi:hypothetical protein
MFYPSESEAKSPAATAQTYRAKVFQKVLFQLEIHFEGILDALSAIAPRT